MFGQRLKAVRESRGYHAKDVAEKIDVSQPTYSNYETGKINPSMQTLEKIAKVLNISTDYLIGLTDDDTTTFADHSLNKHVSTLFEFVEVPILRYASCGSPSLADDDIEGYDVALKSDVNGHECYYLRVRGDSMAEARIHDGDLAFVRKQDDVDDGQIAVVLNQFGEATVKRVYRKDGKVILVPENKKYTAKEFSPDEVSIIGRVLWTKVTV